MSDPLPSNDVLMAHSASIPWQIIEKQKRRFNEAIQALAQSHTDDAIPLEDLSEATGIPITTVDNDIAGGNVLLGHVDGRAYVLGSFVSKRYRGKKTVLQSVVPYNMNPSVNHENLHETHNPETKLRALGAELELGLYYPDGNVPTDEDVEQFADHYRSYARTLGITPTVDREACLYQVEVHVAPGIGYHQTRRALEGIMKSLIGASKATGLYTAIMSSYPIETEFELTDSPKVRTAVDLMCSVNDRFPEQDAVIRRAKERFHMKESANVVQVFRLQGCHVHLDIAGRSEALGLFTFYTMLRSATAVAGAAFLKGGPFVNGTCDAEFLDVREYLRRTTITGRYVELPITPHLNDNGLHDYLGLLRNERANAPARALLFEDGLGEPISAMHNPLGRVRPDLGASKRICTIESTGMPVNISASRQAAVLADFEFTHVLVENYFREHGMDLRPMQDDEMLWMMIGPLSIAAYARVQECSDREGTDALIETPSGEKISLPDFYEMKRLYMHRQLIDVPGVMPRDIDEVYMSLQRMLIPPSGRIAQTPEEYIADPTRRSTGNWGRILRDAFIDEGGTLGEHNPEAVLRVSNRVHEALIKRYAI